jgi:phosphoribosylglycinamide formyltransferase 1
MPQQTEPGLIGILLSGRGSNFWALHEAIIAGRLHARIACVISNVASAPGLEKARQAGYPAYFMDHHGLQREAYDAQLVQRLQESRVKVVCLAGFMRLLSSVMVRAFPNRILNIHPALLPAFPGMHAQKQALEAGVKFSGCTVHFVDEGLDSGPIVLQAVVPVLDEDTEESLAARILGEEHRIYAEAAQLVLDGSCHIAGRRVLLRRCAAENSHA